jgi:hypothetical protein
MAAVFVGLFAIVFGILLFLILFPQGKKKLRDTGPKSEDPADPENSNWKMPRN